MKIFISILFNALILYLLTFLLGENPIREISAGIVVEGGFKTYLIGGIILGIINVTIRPILKLLSLPFFFLFFGLATLVINGIILRLLDYILNDLLMIDGVSYSFVGGVFSINFIIAVAIFTILNMVYSLLFSKK